MKQAEAFAQINRNLSTARDSLFCHFNTLLLGLLQRRHACDWKNVRAKALAYVWAKGKANVRAKALAYVCAKALANGLAKNLEYVRAKCIANG